MVLKKKILFTSSTVMPVKRPIYGVSLLTEYAKNQGVLVDDVLAGTRIKSDDLHDHDKMILVDQELTVIKNLVALIPNPVIGLDIARNTTVGANAHITIPAMFCDTFQEAIVLMFNYIGLSLSYFQYTLSVENHLAHLKMVELFNFEEYRRIIFELELSALYSISKNVLGEPLELKKMHVAYPKPEYAPFYQSLFNCPISFDAEEYVLIFDSAYLDRPLPQANPLVKNAYEKECIKILERVKELNTTIEKILHEFLIHEKIIPSFQTIARRLNMSPRTLRRRLTDEHSSYKSLIAGYLENKAIQLLCQSDFSIEKIAEELGYSSPSNFCHAFKKWTGRTPSSYREKNISSL